MERGLGQYTVSHPVLKDLSHSSRISPQRLTTFPIAAIITSAAWTIIRTWETLVSR